jgi:hypothetical protein
MEMFLAVDAFTMTRDPCFDQRTRKINNKPHIKEGLMMCLTLRLKFKTFHEFIL